MTRRAAVRILARTAGMLLCAFPPASPAADTRGAPDECAVLAALDFTEAVGAAMRLEATREPAADGLPARCRVTGRIAPEIGVEIWLPVDGWNAKLLVAGCYGLCGSIRTDQFEDAAARGYATATTDGGHSEAKYPDSRWALDNVALEEDFGHRAVHLTTVLARALVEAFYGEHPSQAYFRGCSTGGRQALVSAMRYPDDFDGIIAGAPFHQMLSVPHMIWADRANTAPDGRPVLGVEQFQRLHAAALETCDAADGLTDGIVGDPERCEVRPAALACTEERREDCLSSAQVRAAELIYQGPVNPAGRRLAPFGAAPGSELTWARQLLGRDGKPSFFNYIGQNWMRYHAFEPDPPPGTLAPFDFDKDPARLAAGAARVGFEPRLERFAARDGRLILYHGWADESLQPAHTLDYWRKAVRENGGAAELDRFARLFMLPAVEHCGGGIGAGDVDYLAALERWVEEGQAPDMLVAWRTRDSVPTLQRQRRFPVEGEVMLKRPVFPYPAVARYRGSGDPLDPASYERLSPP